MREDGSSVQADAGNAEDGEFDGEDVTRLAHGIITGCLVHAGHMAVGKRSGVKVRGSLRVLVEPEADCVFGDGFVHRNTTNETGDLGQGFSRTSLLCGIKDISDAFDDHKELKTHNSRPDPVWQDL